MKIILLATVASFGIGLLAWALLGQSGFSSADVLASENVRLD
ncbi:hypothetical protein [Oceanomicrobium pacificus]|nr:hypothetical protein [Oceanomicrobium pacificus]